MRNRFFQRACALLVTLAFLGTVSPAASLAAIIDTPTYVESAQRDADLATLSAALDRAEVRDRMAAMGVDVEAIDARLSTLTSAELREMATKMEHMPAGGVDALAVIGAVFLVLIILEFVGVIDIFKKT